MTIAGGAMPIIVLCKTYEIGRSKAYGLINSGAVAVRVVQQGHPDRSDERGDLLGGPCLPAARGPGACLPGFRAAPQPPACHT
jgi:hypothetical protein